MNDYPPERVICDIVELIQDLKAQGFLCSFYEYTNAAVDVYLFENSDVHEAWLSEEDDAGSPTYKRTVYNYGDSNAYAQDLMAMWNEINAYRKKEAEEAA